VKLKKAQRHQRILSELRSSPTVRISKLAEVFGVTTETVRRDVDELSQNGLVDRTYGGATVTSMGSEPTIDIRASAHRGERERIARRAVSLLEGDEVLMIDSGSTTTQFATRLVAAIREESTVKMTIVTNSLGVARILGTNASVRTVLCPGDYDTHEAGIFGPETLDFLRRFRADSAIIGAGGITTEGITDVNSNSSWVKRVMLERTNRSLLLVDHSKFDTNHLEVVCTLDRLTDMVTDSKPGRVLSAALREAKVKVHVAT